MNRFIKLLIGIILCLAYIAATFLWFEAEKEVRILCSMVTQKESVNAVIKTLGTGNFLEYRQTEAQGNTTIIVDSPYTLRTSKCLIHFSDDNLVLSSQYSQSFELVKTAARIAVFVFSCMTIFQICLGLGMPYGHLAWGGNYNVLPVWLRVASIFAAFIYIVGGFLLLVRVDIIQYSRLYKTSEIAAYILLVLFTFSNLGNYMSSSEAERRVMLPVSILLGALCLVIALSG